jgi:AcrR family transcriptional regulator
VPPRRRSQKERVAESERRLLDEAVRLIAEKGFAQTSAAEIGERAGFSREMVRARYGSKDALLTSLLRETFEARLLPRWDTGASGAERVLAQVDGLREALRRDPDGLRAFFVLSFESVTPIQGLRAWIADWVGRYEEQTVAALQIGQRDGSVRAELDATVEARRFIATGIGHAFRWTATPDAFDYDAALIEWRTSSAEDWRS